MSISFRQKSVRRYASAGVMAGGLVLAQLAASAPAAHADPAAVNAVVGVGSDTWQDLGNAFAGAEPTPGAQPPGNPFLATKLYTPLTSGATGTANSSIQIDSFDAIDPHIAPTPGTGQSITAKFGGPTFDRPNGSGEGRAALLDADVSNGLWSTTSGSSPNGPTSVVGQIQWARSSSISGTAGTTLSYIPIGGDAVSYAYHCGSASLPADCTALAHLTTATLKSLYTGPANGTLVGAAWGGTADTLKACAIQTGSGTFSFFGSRTGAGSTSAMKAALVAGGDTCVDLEENNVNGFVTTSTGIDATVDWVIPVSVGSEIGQHNGAALNRSGTGLGTATTGIGTIDGAPGSFPYTGDGTATWAPEPGYYGGSYGRMIFAVVPSKRLSGFTKNQALIDLFQNSGSTSGTAAVCTPAATATSATFGFAQIFTNVSQGTGACGVVYGTRGA